MKFHFHHTSSEANDGFVKAGQDRFPLPSGFILQRDFGCLLRWMRERVPTEAPRKNRLHASLRELANKADLDHSIIAGLETGKRVVSPAILKKLADAFDLEGSDREIFVSLGLDATSKRRRSSNREQFPAELFQLIAGQVLRVKSGFTKNDVQAIHVEPAVETKGGSCTPDIALELKDGTWIVLEVRASTGRNLKEAAMVIADPPYGRKAD